MRKAVIDSLDIPSSLVLVSYCIMGSTILLQALRKPKVDKTQINALQERIAELEKTPQGTVITKQEIPEKMTVRYYSVRPIEEIPIVPNNPEKDKSASKKLRIATIVLFVGVIIGFGIYFGVF